MMLDVAVDNARRTKSVYTTAERAHTALRGQTSSEIAAYKRARPKIAVTAI